MNLEDALKQLAAAENGAEEPTTALQMPPIRAYRLWLVDPYLPNNVVEEVVTAHGTSNQNGTLCIHRVVPHPRGMEILTVAGYAPGEWKRFREEVMPAIPSNMRAS